MSRKNPNEHSGQDGYDEYLFLLQQRNRLLKNLRKKGQSQQELERKEQGFSLYLNGANVDLKLGLSHGKRKSKTSSGDSQRHSRKDVAEDPSCSPDSRAQTAPAPRKGWGPAPQLVKLRTDSGENVVLKAPEKYSGNYCDDFEVYESYLDEQLQLDNDANVNSSHDISHDANTSNKDNSEDDDDDDDDEHVMDELLEHELTLTLEDAKALRQSLELSQSIKENLENTFNIYRDNDIQSKLSRSSGSDDEDISEEIIALSLADEDEVSGKSSHDSAHLTSQPTPMQSGDTQRKSRSLQSARRISDDSNDVPFDKSSSRLMQTSVSHSKPQLTSLPANATATVSTAHQDSPRSSSSESQRLVTSPLSSSSSSTVSPSHVRAKPPLPNDAIAAVTEKVELMSARQQRKLLEMLSDFETLSNSKRIFKSMKQEDSQDHQGTSLRTKNVSAHENIGQVCDKAGKPTSGDGILVEFEIISNWGHAEFVGLTEVQFFNQEGKKIESDFISCCCNLPERDDGSISALTNGRTKTTKGKYMWKTRLTGDRPLVVMFQVHPGIGSTVDDISKILVWNYNQSLKTLSIGCKQVRIHVNQQPVWNGILEKGCGNQIFDYEDVINLKTSNAIESNDSSKPEENEAPTTVLVTEKSPDISSSLGVASLEDNIDHIRNARSSDEFKRSPATQTTLSVIATAAINRCTSTPNLTTAAAISQPLNDPCTRDNTAQSSSEIQGQISWLTDERKTTAVSSSKLRPTWLRDTANRRSLSLDDCNIFPDDCTPVPVRPTLSKRGSATWADSIEDTSSANHVPRCGRRSATPVKSTRAESKDPNRPSSEGALTRSRHSRAEASRVLSPGDVPPPARKAFKEAMGTDLERSFQSIDNFQHHHKGRISCDLVHQDALDLLLDDVKPRSRTSSETESGPVSPPSKQPDSDFQVIPILPNGHHMQIDILSTWGDHHYVGLNGIEVFTEDGTIAPVSRISASPRDINILPEYNNDPRVVSNLIDGIYMTRDDMHLWLAPFTLGERHTIHLTFSTHVTIAMIRIWNYNKSRIHSIRGARVVDFLLDGVRIFNGEIARASGVLSWEEPYGDTILFTTDEDILERVASNDFVYQYEIEEEELLMETGHFTRPTTADKDVTEIERPFTRPKPASPKPASPMTDFTDGQIGIGSGPESPNLRKKRFFGKVLQLNLLDTFGDPHYLGLTGLQVLGRDFEPVALSMDMLEACPRDLNDLPECDSDDRTLDKLIDGVNVTSSDEHMWMIPFTPGDNHVITVTFPTRTTISGIRIWNYNKSMEDTYRGARTLCAAIDGIVITPESGILLRKGPGHCHYDYAQDVVFDLQWFGNDLTSPSSQQNQVDDRKDVDDAVDFDSVRLPTGFIFQFNLLSSCGDAYYIGLNGIALYDESGAKINVSPNNIAAFPDSINTLDGVSNDVRTPDKLVDGVNDARDGRHMWLAPIVPGVTNVVYVVFDVPVTISMIKLWNYAKTPNRGVNQFTVLVDDLLVYSGVLPPVPAHSRAILPTIDTPVPHATVMFSNSKSLKADERKYLLSASGCGFENEQQFQMTNDLSIVGANVENKSSADPRFRPSTSVKDLRRTIHR